MVTAIAAGEVLLAVKIPETLRKQFKSKCAAEGVLMRDRLRELLEEDVKRKRDNNK